MIWGILMEKNVCLLSIIILYRKVLNVYYMLENPIISNYNYSHTIQQHSLHDDSICCTFIEFWELQTSQPVTGDFVAIQGAVRSLQLAMVQSFAKSKWKSSRCIIFMIWYILLYMNVLKTILK